MIIKNARDNEIHILREEDFGYVVMAITEEGDKLFQFCEKDKLKKALNRNSLYEGAFIGADRVSMNWEPAMILTGSILDIWRATNGSYNLKFEMDDPKDFSIMDFNSGHIIQISQVIGKKAIPYQTQIKTMKKVLDKKKKYRLALTPTGYQIAVEYEEKTQKNKKYFGAVRKGVSKKKQVSGLFGIADKLG